mmetsp:Transcript_184090/g.583846  ORF Transcript_184090/g.583846 Transcript_184090/m.583846 type:complete len:202 (-) Transcript_184090:119-724(-)
MFLVCGRTVIHAMTSYGLTVPFRCAWISSERSRRSNLPAINRSASTPQNVSKNHCFVHLAGKSFSHSRCHNPTRPKNCARLRYCMRAQWLPSATEAAKFKGISGTAFLFVTVIRTPLAKQNLYTNSAASRSKRLFTVASGLHAASSPSKYCSRPPMMATVCTFSTTSFGLSRARSAKSRNPEMQSTMRDFGRTFSAQLHSN